MADSQFVSRGGTKLQSALDNFKINPENKICLDVGSSTGGFVDCLLQNGAQKVYSVDTSYGELAWKLRNNPKVIVMERTNILHLDSLPEKIDLVTIDAGWTKLELILPKIVPLLKPNFQIIALLKPHYQVEDKSILKKGVVPQELVEEIKNKVTKNIKSLGFKIQKVIKSPILGTGGNLEYLVLASL